MGKIRVSCGWKWLWRAAISSETSPGGGNELKSEWQTRIIHDNLGAKPEAENKAIKTWRQDRLVQWAWSWDSWAH